MSRTIDMGEAMRLVKVILDRFRSFGTKTEIDIDDLTAFIGGNGAGKTTVLLALNKMFSANASERIIKESDFFMSPQKEDTTVLERKFSCEAIFEMSSIDTDANRSASTAFFSHLVVNGEGEKLILRIRLTAKWVAQGPADGTIDSKISYVVSSLKTNVDDEHLVDASRFDLNNIRMIYVPAVRNPDKQLSKSSNSILTKLINNIHWEKETISQIETKMAELNETVLGERGAKLISEEISNSWKSYYQDPRFSEVSLTMNSNSISELTKKIHMNFKSTASGRKYLPEEMGDGTRSLFYISNVASVLSIESQLSRFTNSFVDEPSIYSQQPALTIVAIEEPENHISPHLLGKLIVQLSSISVLDNAQVLITSHSPAIVKRVEPESIRYIRIDNDNGVSEAHSLNLPDKESDVDAYKFVKQAVYIYPELYFARLVILGEGESEEIVLESLFRKAHGPLDTAGISIVPLGGRFVSYLWKLLDTLHIPYVTLLDLDVERKGGGWGRVAYILQEIMKVNSNTQISIAPNQTIDDNYINDMKNREIHTQNDKKALDEIVLALEKYHVYFSNPLDLDFAMLENNPDLYKATAGEGYGPRIDDNGVRVLFDEYFEQHQNTQKANKKIDEIVRRTLKKEGGEGGSYSDEQKKLMAWYNYLFLGKGKPITHILALANVLSDNVNDCTPWFIGRLETDVLKQLDGEKIDE